MREPMDGTSTTDFALVFKHLTGHAPFPWQIKLFEEVIPEGQFPRSCNLPTGLGKTSLIAIWFIALMSRPEKVPRRLVYVVNRRTVVDQTTEEVENLRTNLETLENKPNHAREVAISTLRGQFADNREWSVDPSRPAVICGTVDMIGSRLLFSGYGVGFKTKPLHAGFLGQDVLLVHDEAHLEPAFQKLILAIEKEQREGERSEDMPWPKLRVMELTATSRGNGLEGQSETPFELTSDEKNPPKVIPDRPTEPIHHVWRRITAKKGIKFHLAKRADVAKRIGVIARDRKASGSAVLVFVRTIADVLTVQRVLSDKKEGVPIAQIQVLTGTLRGRERDQMTTEDRVFARFLHEPKAIPNEGTVYLICTSAGEVGVDMSADHMVCDLATLDSMTQRLGRVNRRGAAAAEVDVVYETDPDPKPKSPTFEKARWNTKAILERLPKCPWAGTENRYEASPLELLNLQITDDERSAAFAPRPRILPVTDILFDAWALTTISPPLVRTPLPGRPSVEPYLHGISDWQPPDTHVAWREEVEVICGGLLEIYNPEDLLDDYPLKPHELLRDRSDRVFEELKKIAVEHPEAPVWVVDTRGQVEVKETLKTLTNRDSDVINYKTILLPPFVGGLNKSGMLDGGQVLKATSDEEEVEQSHEQQTGIQYDVADEWYETTQPAKRRRVRVWNAFQDGMTLEREIRVDNADDEDGEPPSFWRWFVRRPDAVNERSRIAYPLEPHLNEVKHAAEHIVERLDKRLPGNIGIAVILAAFCHDLGKHRKRWQRSLGNDCYPDEVYAKSGQLQGREPLRPRDFLRDHYRHEFGSILDLLDESHSCHGEFKDLSSDMQELVLHLIASHHGRARPHFPMDEAFDSKPRGSSAAALAVKTPRRFARLQRQYGRWGLAYLESLVRAADYAASANPGLWIDEKPKRED
jgi:CRISPR-associated endonuclease/helicase Cas3